MLNVMKVFSFIVFSMAIGTLAWAGNDPSIKDKQRSDIQSAMANHVVNTQKGGVYLHYDPVAGKLKKLKLKKLHSGIVRKGDFFVSCADFTDTNGKLYDLDFLVLEKNGKYMVNQSIVHAVEEVKRPYQVEN
ncbi:hypothetical protein MNBD_NITROSPINAE02-479 [hydrothermal vent metagenome]|uniref:Uncharacterized protein n=1 Tax=hydrothermal vent metagenome TaxID=652676 RepID=A0A3B1BYZ6_9ZZZZ